MGGTISCLYVSGLSRWDLNCDQNGADSPNSSQESEDLGSHTWSDFVACDVLHTTSHLCTYVNEVACCLRQGSDLDLQRDLLPLQAANSCVAVFRKLAGT